MKKLTDESDFDLLAAWTKGDRRAGNVLFERYYRTVDRFFTNKANEAVCADLTQKTFLACQTAIPRFQGKGEFRAFLLGIARNILKQHYRYLSRRSSLVCVQDALAIHDDRTPSASLARQEEQRILLGALRRLPLDLQIVLELRFWEQLPYAEISAIAGISVAKAKNQVVKARRCLREIIANFDRGQNLLESTLTNLDGWAEKIRAEHARE